jgi:uncharacterized integral membrane protein
LKLAGRERSRRAKESVMSRRWQIAIGGIVLAIILLIVGIPAWVPVLILIAALAVPVVGYLMLDSNQRTRIRRMRQRKQIR